MTQPKAVGRALEESDNDSECLCDVLNDCVIVTHLAYDVMYFGIYCSSFQSFASEGNIHTGLYNIIIL